jgi:PHD/YefM family antitoxin component YafN of YafNO toxin-antitoxin module
MAKEHVLRITHLRDCLGWAYQQVARTGEPIIIQRYSRKDAVIVTLEEWRLLKQIAADLQMDNSRRKATSR